MDIVLVARPAIANALPNEISHAAAFVALNMKSDVLAGVTAFAGTFQAASGKMLDILTSAGSGGLTPEQQKGLNDAMTALTGGVGAQVQLLQNKSTGAATLSDAINSPNSSFLSSQQAAQTYIDNVNQNIKDLQDLVNNPFADQGEQQQAALGILVDQTKLGWLQGFQSTMQSLISTNNAMGAALSQALIVWQTLNQKYQYVAEQMSQAGTNPGILSSGDVKSAQLGWSQIEAYVKGLS